MVIAHHEDKNISIISINSDGKEKEEKKKTLEAFINFNN